MWRLARGNGWGHLRLLGDDERYFLFDSFEGMPPAKEIDGPAALAWQAAQAEKNSPAYFDNCAAERKWADEAMALAGTRRYHAIQGWFDQTLPGFVPPEPIAILRLDADWYDSVKVCLNCLFPRMARGGVVIVDDYRTWDGCSRAVHDYLSEQKSAVRISQFRDNVCYLHVK